ETRLPASSRRNRRMDQERQSRKSSRRSDRPQPGYTGLRRNDSTRWNGCLLRQKNVRSAGPGSSEHGRSERSVSRQEGDSRRQMNTSVEELQQQTAIVSASRRPAAETAFVAPPVVKSRPQTWLAVPVGACIALAIHFLVPKREIVPPTHYYPLILSVMLGLGVLGAALHPFFAGLRKWMRQMCPILGVATVTAAVWELATSCFGLLPLPYFPGPEGVFGSLVSDRSL